MCIYIYIYYTYAIDVIDVIKDDKSVSHDIQGAVGGHHDLTLIPAHPIPPCQTARSARSNESVEKSPRPSAAELSPQKLQQTGTAIRRKGGRE